MAKVEIQAMRTDYCHYPPLVAADVDVTQASPHSNGVRTYIVGAHAAGRYILLRETEYQVLSLLGRSLTPND